jgi:hypothetical protein
MTSTKLEEDINKPYIMVISSSYSTVLLMNKSSVMVTRHASYFIIKVYSSSFIVWGPHMVL